MSEAVKSGDGDDQLIFVPREISLSWNIRRRRSIVVLPV